MGAILSQLKQYAKQRKTTPLLGISLSKLREYHGSFKSICDNFTLDLSDFEEIFGVDKDSFAIWDTDGTELIDALELFSGLVIFSDSKFEDKIRFLFDLFDFNELNSLSIVDLEFMLYSCLNSTFKIYGIKHELNEDAINAFLNESFMEDSRINISQLVKWCAKSSQIHDFFTVIKKEMALVMTHAQGNQSGFNKFVTERKGGISTTKKIQEAKAIGTIFNNQKYKSKLEYLSSIVSKTQVRRDETNYGAIKDTIIKMNWVYGFRCNDIRHPLKYVGSERGKTVTEKLIYFTGCIVVIYDPKSNEQTHYLDHEREIISLAVSQTNLVATGELGDLPAIHIWDCDTLQNIAILKGIHDLGVHLLAFMKNDEFIVSCGIRTNSPLLIYNIKDTSLVLSTYLVGFALDLRPIVSYIAVPDKKEKTSKYQIDDSGDDISGNSFFACSQDAVFVFTYDSGGFTTGNLLINEYEILSPITCCVALRVNADNPYLKAYVHEADKSLVFLTGHSGGKVLVWENLVLREELVDYRSEILAITCLDFGVVIATDSSFLYFWDLNLKNNFKKFDLCSLQFKLFSFKITSIAPAKNKMYLATTEGDVVEISLSQKKELHKNTYSYKIQAQKLNNISKLKGTMKAITLLERADDTLVFVTGDSAIISAYSLESHDLVDLWSLGESITAIDIVSFEDGSNVFAMGTITGKIHLRYDWEELPRGYECGARILDLKFSHDAGYLVAISEVSIVFIFILIDNSYFNKKPKKIEFEGECPISVNFSDDNKVILIGTSQKNHYLLEINEQNPKPININEIAEKIDLSILNIRYPSHAKNFLNTMQPVSFGKNSNAILSADESGIIFYWKDKENLANNCGGYLKGHSSQISRIVLARNTNVFYSLGASDRTLIEWKIETVTEEIEENSNKNIQDQNAKMKIEDETLIRELEYSSFFDNIPDQFKDSFTFFRGTTDKTLISILHNHVQPFEDAPLFKRYPNFSLEPHFIYGFQSYEKRNTLFYGHYVQPKVKKPFRADRDRDIRSKEDIRMVTEEDETHVFLNRNISLFNQPPTHKQVMFAKEVPGSLSFEPEHESCDRYFVYFVSRIAIIYDPLTNAQRFYEGHRYRITTMSMHPSKAIVATGETSPSPCVHIWSLTTLEPLRIIKTFHKNGILNAQFSKDGVFLITVGIDLFYSVQVTKWKSEEIVAFRNTDRACIFDIVFNPYDKYEFATVGYSNIAVWNIEGRTLVRKEWIHDKDPDDSLVIYTAVTYFNYKLRKEIGSDLIVGNNYGSIGLVTGGKYFSLREDAHTKMINCIKITSLLGKDLVVISSSQDETVKFWDIAFNLLHEVSVRRIESPKFVEIPLNQDVSVQSIDVYECGSASAPPAFFNGRDNNYEGQNKPLILLGTRNGYIIEATVDRAQGKVRQPSEKKIHVSINKTKIVAYTTSMTDMEQDIEDEESSDDEGTPTYRFENKKNDKLNMSLSFVFYLTSHSGTPPAVARNYQQRVLFALHPKLNVMFTVGEDQYLSIWDVDKCTLLKQVKQDNVTPTALKITPDGEILAIGFNNGMVVLQDAKMTANPLGKYSEPYNLPTLNFIQAIKGQVPVLNIEFSSKGEFMAISFDNPRVSKDGEEEKTIKEGSSIDIYVSRVSHKFVKTKMSEKNLYNKYADIKSQSLYQTHETDVNQYGVAAYYITFSLDDYYLLIYYQTVDNNQIRVNEDTQGHYAVWDLNADNRLWNPDTIKNLQWRKMNFPNNIYAQYLSYPNILGTEDTKKDPTKLGRRPIMSSMFNYNTFIVAGSTIGDIHFFKERALDFEKDPMLENLEPEKMCMSKTYNAHVSFVNQVEIKGTYLFSTGMHDGCVIQWRFIEEEEQWEADFRDFTLDQPDPFLELPPKDKFDNLMNEILPLRHQVYEIQQNLDEITEPEINLELEAVIGRKAFNRRNNLFYDFYDRIVYSTGNLLVMYDPRIGFKFEEESDTQTSLSLKRQEFLKIDEGNFFSTSPEISAYTLSSDKRFLCAGTQELNARILIWEICSRTCIKTLKLSNCTAIQIIRFAYDSQHICAVGTSLDYTQVVYLIDSAKPQVLGCVNLLNTLRFKIKDINFFPNSIYKFVTCGVQHMNVWKYSGSVLTFSTCSLENPKDTLVLKQNVFQQFDGQELMPGEMSNVKDQNKSKDEEDFFTLEVTFLCLCFVQNLIITGGEDGFIYIWKDFKIIKKQSAHFKCSVLCLSSIQTSNIFVSGGQDGRVIVWQVLRNTENNSFLIDMLHDCPITNDDITKAYLDLKNHVQSVYIDNKKILAGTRNGNIYEIAAKHKKMDKNKGPLYGHPVTRLICHDDEIPKCIGFSPSMERIYGITQKGLFCVWNIKDLQLNYFKHLSKMTTSMIVFKFKPLILIAFETEIIILDCENDYLPIPSYRLVYKTQINDVKVSFNEKYLAVALASDSNTSARIEMYDLEKEDKVFKHLFAIEELTSSINFLDFSLDNNYLLYKDNLEELTATDISSKKKINFIHSEFDVEWMSDGIQISEKTKGVQSYYTDDNKIQKMIRIGDSTLAVTDEMGTIRLFKYPCEAGSSLGYYKCYTEHMNYVNNLVLSSDGNYLLTTSESDKSIFLWRVKYLLKKYSTLDPSY